MTTKCANCGRKLVVKGEGRIIDGSWPWADEYLKRGDWYCCYDCIDRTVARRITEQKVGAKVV